MHFLLREQVRSYRALVPLNNLIVPEYLGGLEQKMLREALLHVKHLQVRVSYDFLGTMST